MRIRIDNVGELGIVKDVPGYELPANAWTDGQNVRMQDGSVHKARGYEASVSPVVTPYYLYPVQTPSASYWLACGLNEVYALHGQYKTRVGTGYNATSAHRWQATNLGGVVVLNNGADLPVYWPFPTDTNNSLSPLSGLTDHVKIITAYKDFLVACNVTRSGTQYPTMVKWSHRADPGVIPSSWDIADATLDAGETILPQSGGEILDNRTMRDISVIYRSGSTWAMSHIGPPFIFRFWPLFETSGILTKECVAEFFGNHFVVTQDDIVVHDGQSVKSIATQKWRRQLFSEISSAHFDRAFVVHHAKQKEMWACYPTSDSTCDKALVWNYAENSWGKRDLPNITHAAYGVTDAETGDFWDAPLGTWSSVSISWASASGSWELAEATTWADNDDPWDHRAYSTLETGVLYATDPLYIGDTTNANNGAAMTAYIQRTGLAVVGPNKADIFKRKLLRGVYPHIEGTEGGVINVYVGAQQSIGSEVRWESSKPFTIGTSYKIDANADGRLVALKFESTTDIEWRLHGYELDLEVTGD